MKLKIVVLIDWFLPGNKAGGPVKSIYSLIKTLKDTIDFYVITMNTDIASNKEYVVKPNEWTTYDDIQVYYFSKNNFSSQQLIKVIDDISPNAVYINSFWSYKFSILPLVLKKLKKLKYPLILAPRGMLEDGAMNIKSFKKKIFIFLSKIVQIHKNIIFHATSMDEQASIKNFYPDANIIQVPNISYIEPCSVQLEKKKKELKLFFLSRVTPIKGLDFAIHILSQLQLPDDYQVEYDIYGNNEDKEYFKECKSLIKKLPPNIKVTYKGTLSFQDIGKTISHYHFLFLPTKNENFGHAIVETLMCERPVLISNCTPWNEVNANHCGYALPLDENTFIACLKNMIEMEDAEFQTMCLNAKNFIQNKLTIEQLKKDYLNLFQYATKSQS